MGSLRTILALAVVLAHCPLNQGFVFVGGKNAVQLFYMISGFLIAHVIDTNKTYRDPRKFYINRALRLYPIYFAVLLLTLLGTLVANRKFFDLYGRVPAAASALLIISNMALFGQDWVMFAGIKNGHLVFASDFNDSDFLLYQGLLVPQAWTLGVELGFYAIAPFIFRNKKIVILLLVLSLCIRVLLLYLGIGMKDPWSYRFFPAELSLFLLGALSNKYLLPLWEKFVKTKNRNWMPGFATLLLALLFIFYFLIPVTQYVKAPILFATFLILMPLPFLYQNKSKIDKAIGELSYPIYIGHMLVIMVVEAVALNLNLHLGDFTISLINVCLACIFACLLNELIGKRVELIRVGVKSSKS